jgi:cytochrome c553
VIRTLVGLATGLAITAASWNSWGPDEGRARGRILFDLCAQCHGPAGGGSPLALAPAIGGLSQWYVEAQLQKFKGRVRGAHPEDLAGMRMAPMSRTLETEDDVRAVAAYVASLPAARRAFAVPIPPTRPGYRCAR